ncbi:MAG: hypothetical protein WC942_07315 [Clostridia bacterium]|jgi:hypothetical protein
MLSKILKDSVGIPKTIGYKITKGLATLSDEEEACTNPEWAYLFAKYIPGANIVKCQEAACKDPEYAYLFCQEYSWGGHREVL